MEGDISPLGNPAEENNTLISEGNKEFWQSFKKTVNDFVDSVTLEKIERASNQFVGYEYNI